MGVNGKGNGGSSPPRWLLVIQPGQEELYDVLRERLEGTEVHVVLDRRGRERRRGSLGPTMERRNTDRRRQRPMGLVARATSREAGAASAAVPARGASRTEAARAQENLTAHRCPTCSVMLELEMPRFPNPPARVDMEIGHVGASGQDSQHYAEIAAFTISGRILLSQRLPARVQR